MLGYSNLLLSALSRSKRTPSLSRVILVSLIVSEAKHLTICVLTTGKSYLEAAYSYSLPIFLLFLTDLYELLGYSG